MSGRASLRTVRLRRFVIVLSNDAGPAVKSSFHLKEEVQRPDVGLRLIIVWKFVKAAVLCALGITAFALVHSDIHALALRTVRWLGLDPAGHRVARAIAIVAGLTPDRIAEIGVGAIIYACVNVLEGWGLHRRRTWAEWLTISLTSLLVPIEIYELARYPSAGKVATLVVNVLIVIYLARHRFLFVSRRR